MLVVMVGGCNFVLRIVVASCNLVNEYFAVNLSIASWDLCSWSSFASALGNSHLCVFPRICESGHVHVQIGVAYAAVEGFLPGPGDFGLPGNVTLVEDD